MDRKINKENLRRAGIAIGILLLLYYIIHHVTQPKPLEIPLPTVVVQKPELIEVVDYINQTGTTVAYNSVNLVARIKGYLEEINFIDGRFIKKGASLFVIEPQPYLDKVKEAKAQVAATKASDTYNKSEYARQKRMYKDNATSLNSVEKWYAKTLEIQSEIEKAEANAEIAAINYSYTHLVAPFDGRIGRHLVDIGNLVGNGEATKLATIEQISPLYVYFNLNEIDFLRLRELARQSGFKPSDLKEIVTDVTMQNSSKVYKAYLDFINTGLNASTGTMEIRAVLENKDHNFVPGLFVQVKIPITKPAKQLTVPDTAILYDQIGPYLFTITKDNIVELKHVELGSVNQGRRAILKGINQEDRVVIDGLQFTTPGGKVNVQAIPDKKKPS